MTPVLYLSLGTKFDLKITTYDDDGDIVKCRWALASKFECNGICQTVPFATLDETTCTVTFDLTNFTTNIGWYGAAFQIEDFNSTSSTTPYSSVPLQFLIKVARAARSCSTP